MSVTIICVKPAPQDVRIPQPRGGNQSRARASVKPRQQTGFTLIELMVVIGCLGVLAATILPVLAASKANTQSAACLNNLRRLGAAVHMYASDHNDEMVYPNWGTVNQFDGWLFRSIGAANLQMLNAALGRINGQPVCPPANPNNANVQSFIYGQGELYPYIRQVSPYWCPAQDASCTQSPWYQNVFLSSPGSTSVSGNEIYSTYIMNGAVVNFPSAIVQNPAFLGQFKLSNVHFGPNDVLMWEPQDTAPAYNDASSAAANSDRGDPSQRHITGCPLLRIDGGSEMQEYSYILSQMSGFPTSPQGITPQTPFNNEFFYAPGYVDGGFSEF